MNAGEPVVVVGSGPAGSTAAAILADAGVNVLVLEAGSEGAPLGMTARVRGVTVAKRRPQLSARAGVTATDAPADVYEALAPGGLSNHWSCAVPRFGREDFEDGARAGVEQTWPISYEDLVPAYERVEPFLHVAGASRDFRHLPASRVQRSWQLAPAWDRLIAEAEASGRSIAPMPYAYGGETTVTPGGTVFNAFVRLIQPRARERRLSVRFDARALRLDWSARTRRVQAVVIRDSRTGGEARVPCRAVVLAAGAVNSAQILLESANADFPTGLGDTHGVLGRYVHDHPLAKLVLELPSPLPVHPPAYVTRLSLERSRPLYAAACMQWSGTGALVKSVLRARPGRLKSIGFSVFGTMAPTRDNFVELDKSAPRVDGASALKLHIRHPPESTLVLEETRDQLLGLFERSGIQARLGVWKVEPVFNSVHYGGTCRMHASPEFGLIDGFSRLHAVRNVAVADSAAFTTSPEKNPVVTAMALAARAAERIAAELRSGDI